MHTAVLVDDEPWVIIDALHSVDWGRFGFRVMAHYEDPEAALEQIILLKPDLVFTDIRMPKLDGLELIRRCREAGVTSTFVLLSGYSDFEYAREGLRLGVKDYCLKPLDVNAIHSLLLQISSQLDPQPIQSSNFEKVTDFIRLHAQERLRLDDVAEAFGYNKNYLCSLFKKHLNLSFIQYLTQIRIENSCEMLRNTSLSIDQIAQRSGLGDYAYFSKTFKKYKGQTPAAYRNDSRKDEPAP